MLQRGKGLGEAKIKTMKKLTTIELCGLGFGAALILFGLFLIAFPQPARVPHYGHGAFSSASQATLENVTEGGSRTYGAISLLLGAGLGLLAFYPARRSQP